MEQAFDPSGYFRRGQRILLVATVLIGVTLLAFVSRQAAIAAICFPLALSFVFLYGLRRYEAVPAKHFFDAATCAVCSLGCFGIGLSATIAVLGS